MNEYKVYRNGIYCTSFYSRDAALEWIDCFQADEGEFEILDKSDFLN